MHFVKCWKSQDFYFNWSAKFHTAKFTALIAISYKITYLKDAVHNHGWYCVALQKIRYTQRVASQSTVSWLLSVNYCFQRLMTMLVFIPIRCSRLQISYWHHEQSLLVNWERDIMLCTKYCGVILQGIINLNDVLHNTISVV